MRDTSVNFLKRWLSFMMIYPWYNGTTRIFSSSPVKLVLFLILLLALATVKQVSKVMLHDEATGIFVYLGELMMFLMVLDSMLINTSANSRKITKLFAFMDRLKIGMEIKTPKYDYIKCVVIIWNLIFLVSMIVMCVLFVSRVPFLFAAPRYIEMIVMYFVQASIVWRHLLFREMRTQLECINSALRHVDVGFARGNSYEVHLHTLLDQLIKRHNIIVNWVDVFNDLFGPQMLMNKVYESLHVLAVLDMHLNQSFQKNMLFSIGEATVIGITCFVLAQALLTANSCEQLTLEGRRTVCETNNLLLHCDVRNVEVRRQLKLLWKQATDRCPQISAMGFFVINHSLIFTLINMTVSYVIVIIQMHHANH